MKDRWHALLGASEACACGRVHVVATREVVIGPGAAERVGELVARHAPGLTAAVVADDVTWDVLGARVADRLDTTGDLARVILQPPGGAATLHADDACLALLHARLPADVGIIVCVGSGTLNDLTKLAASARGIPSLCVATAPSMNGYPSAIAAISRGGIKLTEPCEPPVAIVCDRGILAAAPAPMIQAGLGDLLSKSTSSADWLMAHLVCGEYYCERPVAVVAQAEAQCAAQAAAIGRCEPEAVERLAAGLIQSGISMAMAGSSSPASGGEHLISHYWDMTAEARGRAPDLHGRQVAVATVLAARLYERLRVITLRGVNVDGIVARAPRAQAPRRRSLAHFEPLLGAAPAREVARMVVGKHAHGDALRRRIAVVADDPRAFWARLSPGLRAAADLTAAYRAGGVPTEAAELGIAREELRDALVYARHIRERYTVLDLAADLGLLEDLAEELVG